MKSLEVNKHMTNKQLSAFLEALAIIAEQNPEAIVKNIRRIQSKLEKKKATDVAASVAKQKQSF